RAEWGEYIPNWHPWEDYRCSYSARKDLGGGAILTLIHPLDYLYWLFGEVKRIHASMRSISSLQTDTDDDLAEITLEFTSGVIGQVHLDYIQRPPIHTLMVWGDNGRVKWDYHAGTLCWETVDGSIQVEEVPDGFERNTMFIDEMRHFLECVEQHKPTQIPLEDGIAVLEIALRAKQGVLGRERE
ncbi:MAG: gfo/Idh/MocA family oxidoreductase, partial [Proteobacteria bacterium]|nr:gfo/Idh/MocA family oxidoreductase [Pseudomonadota bacterium]